MNTMNKKNLELDFRTATPDDVTCVLRIIAQAQAQMKALGSEQWQDGYPARGDIMVDVMSGVGCVAECEGRVVAYCAVVFDGEPAYEALCGEWLSQQDYVVVHRLAVADEVKRRGVATRVMRHVEEMARQRGLRSFKIDTMHDNRYMHTMLATLGFKACGTVRYASGERVAFEKTW